MSDDALNSMRERAERAEAERERSQEIVAAVRAIAGSIEEWVDGYDVIRGQLRQGGDMSDAIPVEFFSDLRHEVDLAAQRYAEVEAERDGLRMAVRDVGVALGVDWWNGDASVIDGVQQLRAERDRLLAVVGAAREALRLRDASREVAEPSDWDDEREVQEFARRLARSTVATSDALDVVAERLDQLDANEEATVSEFTSPIDGHRHFGDAGRAECAVCCLEAERDRLRAVVADITEHATPIAEDDDGFVAVGYTVTVGAIHRALAALQGAGDDDPLHPLMPTGKDQVFRDWLDFVERVARPIVETEDDDAAEQAAMALYRKASPFFICAALVMAVNERNRLRVVVDAVREWNRARGRLLIADTVEDEDRATDALDIAGQEALTLLDQLDVSPSIGGNPDDL